jgi:hypothetical protein
MVAVHEQAMINRDFHSAFLSSTENMFGQEE